MLAAAAAKASLATTAARFVTAAQVPEVVRSSAEITRVLEFWGRVRKIPVTAFFSTADSMIRSFNLVDSAATQSNLFCLVAKQEIAALLGRDRTGRLAGDWKIGLVMPFWDLPGRIRSLLIMTETDSALISTRYKRSMTPGGFGMLSTALAFGRRFIVDDPAAAVRIQARHMASSRTPLPIAVPPPLDDDWQAGSNLQGVSGGWACWSPSPVRAARLAYAMDGTAVPVTAALTPDKLHASLKKIGAVKTLDRIALEAVPRRRAAIAICEAVDGHPPLALVRSLTSDLVEEKLIIRGLSDAARDRLIAERRLAGKSIRINGKDLIDNGRQWRLPSGELVADGVLVIRKTILRQPGNTIYYAGEIRHRKGSPVPFLVLAADMDADPFSWMRGKMIKAGFGFTFDARWSKLAVTAAQQLRPPVTSTFPGIGWHSDLCSFLFPRVTIDGNGARDSTPTPAEPRTPCERFRANGTVDSVAMGRPESALTWATIACTLTSAISYAHGLVSPNFAVLGNPQNIANATAAAGCPVVSAKKPSRHARAIHAIEAAADAHRWPHRLVRHPTYRYRLSTDLIDSLPPGWFAPIEPIVADTLLLRGGWCSIDASSPSDDTIDATASETIVAFLSSLCQQGLQLPAGDTQLSRVLAALESWFAPQGPLDGIVAARRLLQDDTPAQALNALGRIMASAVVNVKARVGMLGKISSNYFDRRSLAWTAAIDESTRTFQIPVTPVLDSIAAWSKFALDRATIEARLVATGTVSVDGEHWITPLDWWATTMNRYKRKSNG